MYHMKHLERVEGGRGGEGGVEKISLMNSGSDLSGIFPSQLPVE